MTNITPKKRMLTAYKGEKSDRVPVAPEFWFYIPAKVLGIDMVQLEREIPHWQALQKTFKHYNCEGWGIVQPEPKYDLFPINRQLRRIGESRYEEKRIIHTPKGKLTARTLYDKKEPSWKIERFIKNFQNDGPFYEKFILREANEYDWPAVQEALDKVGDDYLLEVLTGFTFIDFIGWEREGGLEQTILDIVDYEHYLLKLQKRYIHWITEFTQAIFSKTTAESVNIPCIWSTLSLVSPRMWRKWDKPVIEAVVDAAHQMGGLVHLHFHGNCMEVVEDFAQLGIDCVCPFERPPGGDVTNLRKVKKKLAGRVTFSGNVHTVETLIRGTPGDVKKETIEILEAWESQPRLILGTGDQVGKETPEDNIYTMIETAKKFGKY